MGNLDLSLIMSIFTKLNMFTIKNHPENMQFNLVKTPFGNLKNIQNFISNQSARKP